jgi:hypothetical protein
MKKTFVIGFILCFLGVFFGILSAQEYKNFDLSKYYTVDIVRNQMDFVGSSNGALNSSSTNILNISNDNAFNGNLSSNFSNYMINRQLIRTINVGIGFGGNAGGSSDFVSEIKQQSGTFSTTGGIGTTYQLFNKANQFLSFGGNFNYAFNSNIFNKTNTSNKTDAGTNNNFTGKLYVYAGAGIGRIESVTDAQQTIYLIDAFTKNKILSRDLTSNEIFTLSQEISRIKNKRFLDSRLHLIDEVSHIDSFFIANKLIDKSNANYFTTLYDVWLYGDKFERKSGSSIELKFSSDMNFNNSNTNNTYMILRDSVFKTKGNNSGSENNICLSYSYEKPVQQKWQHSVNALLILSFANYWSTSQDLILNSTYKASSENKTTSAFLAYKLGFYPNTRTNIFAQISQNVGYNIYSASTINGNTQVYNPYNLSFDTNFNGGMYYYFSPQLRLSATLNLSNKYEILTTTSNIPVSNYFSGNFSIGVNYSFF